MAKNLNEASRAAANQAKADALNALDGIGSDRSLFGAVLSPIEDAAAAFIERVKHNIESQQMIVTGKIDELGIVANESGVQIYGQRHLKFQDKGVNGSVNKLYDTPYSYKDKPPPWQAFVEWINTKNIQLRNEEKYTRKTPAGSSFAALEGDDKDIEAAARAIAWKVFRDGLKPRNLYTKEIPQLIKDITTSIPGFLANNITEVINGLPPKDVTLNL